MHIRTLLKFISLKGFRFFQNTNLSFEMECKLKFQKIFQTLIIVNYFLIMSLFDILLVCMINLKKDINSGRKGFLNCHQKENIHFQRGL